MATKLKWIFIGLEVVQCQCCLAKLMKVQNIGVSSNLSVKSLNAADGCFTHYIQNYCLQPYILNHNSHQ